VLCCVVLCCVVLCCVVFVIVIVIVLCKIVHLRGVVATSSLLESTSLVAAYGLDVFFSRVTPANPFDLLDEVSYRT